MERDLKNLELAKQFGDYYVYVDLKSGKIMGRSRTSTIDGKQPECRTMYERMTVEEYEWLTDKTRETKIVTAADIYDKVSWTGKGFVVCGEYVSANHDTE